MIALSQEELEKLAGGGAGGCFVATASYGDYNHPFVKILCLFRDKYLLTNHWGQHFVEWYYKNSPILSKVICSSRKSSSTGTNNSNSPRSYCDNYFESMDFSSNFCHSLLWILEGPRMFIVRHFIVLICILSVSAASVVFQNDDQATPFRSTKLTQIAGTMAEMVRIAMESVGLLIVPINLILFFRRFHFQIRKIELS